MKLERLLEVEFALTFLEPRFEVGAIVAAEVVIAAELREVEAVAAVARRGLPQAFQFGRFDLAAALGPLPQNSPLPVPAAFLEALHRREHRRRCRLGCNAVFTERVGEWRWVVARRRREFLDADLRIGLGLGRCGLLPELAHADRFFGDLAN